MDKPRTTRLWEMFLYLFFGGVTTIVNIAVYAVCYPHFSNLMSNGMAWLCAVLLAFFTNKRWVFQSRSFAWKQVSKEASSFFLCRIATACLDMGIMYVAVTLCAQNALLWKILSNVIVIILNYVAGRRIAFSSTISLR